MTDSCIPVESIIYDRQEDYYRSLAKSDSQSRSTMFIEFMLEMIQDAVNKAVITEQVQRLLFYLKEQTLGGREVMNDRSQTQKYRLTEKGKAFLKR